ncbi:MAG: hypothetical protein MK188_11795 [Gammaproteobacteria bacterium]|nr:hypothetical protein [Gammaproteobacteria bacterium]
MIKKILLVLLALVVAAAVGLYIFAGKLDGLIKEAIETEGTAALGSQVSVASVVTDFQQGRAEISGLTIANPAGYQSAHAIELSNFAAEVDYADQTVKEIIINQPVINAEQKGKRNNFQDLLDGIPETATEETSEAENTDSGPEITIKKIALKKATINLFTSDLEVAGQSIDIGNRSFVMDDYIVNNITGTAEEISETISKGLIAHVTAQIKSYLSSELKTIAKDKAIEKAKEQAQKAIEEKLGGELGEKLPTEDLKDKLKGKIKLKGFN